MKSEKGYSLIELLIAVSVSAMLAAGASMTTFQIFRGSKQNSDWNVAVRQAQSLGQWVSQDALMVNTIEIGDDPGTSDVEFISLFWKDWENGNTYDTRYLWFDAEDSLKQLTRKQVTRDMDGVEIDNKSFLVADNVYTATLTPETNSWRLTVETRSGSRSVTREYEISKRLQE
ncbi:MAG TPA: prepilin-type N-terminal cleavage/methylation domain-containing protein [Dehalococcoidia bacterium]|nr:prepilin-type N-terminal cleavage/methylation domain-containing protein [Dehalococcoidia bacterium]